MSADVTVNPTMDTQARPTQPTFYSDAALNGAQPDAEHFIVLPQAAYDAFMAPSSQLQQTAKRHGVKNVSFRQSYSANNYNRTFVGADEIGILFWLDEAHHKTSDTYGLTKKKWSQILSKFESDQKLTQRLASQGITFNL